MRPLQQLLMLQTRISSKFDIKTPLMQHWHGEKSASRNSIFDVYQRRIDCNFDIAKIA
ncbi:hypothetical protein [Azospirillum melinis]